MIFNNSITCPRYHDFRDTPLFETFFRRFIRRCRLPYMCFSSPFLSTPSLIPCFLCIKDLYIDTVWDLIHRKQWKKRRSGGEVTYTAIGNATRFFRNLFLLNCKLTREVYKRKKKTKFLS
jgi:hypothetical protein